VFRGTIAATGHMPAGLHLYLPYGKADSIGSSRVARIIIVQVQMPHHGRAAATSGSRIGRAAGQAESSQSRPDRQRGGSPDASEDDQFE
jgi:hypothetical protein